MREDAQADDHRVVAVLALMAFLVPSIGVPSELILQDTLKSTLVVFASLGAALLLGTLRLRQPRPMRWHPVLWLPLLLALWALGSMGWSHTYLAGVEALRWLLFTLLLWLGLQVLQPERLDLLAQGVHWGAVVAALWAGLQFWVDLRVFPQAAMPGSTFSNRNFLAEYLVCCLPFSVWVAAHARGGTQVVLRCAATALVALVIVLTGTRSALLATTAMLPCLVVLLWRQRAALAWPLWSRAQQATALATLAAVFIGLGSLPGGNADMLQENPGRTALQRSAARVGMTVSAGTSASATSLNERFSMWQSNLRLIRAHPWSGVGAGAWEVEIPRFQPEGIEIEEDYYAHNEALQLLAEYGLAGWIFLLALLAYLLRSALRARSRPGAAPASWRSAALVSLLGLMVVSLAGFPWHLAGTGALFALSLAVLAATDHMDGIAAAPTTSAQSRGASPMPWKAATLIVALALAPATWLVHRAWASETRLVRAAQMAYQITLSGRADDPAWAPRKAEMLRLLKEGVDLHPHYRKLTSLVADDLLRWQDERNARWVLESLAASRPYVVVILAQLGRLHAQAGELPQAEAYLQRARALQPRGPAVLSLQFLILRKQGRTDDAAALARDMLGRGLGDADLLGQAYQLAIQRQDWPLAIDVLKQRIQRWPATALESWLRLAHIQSLPEVGDRAGAIQSYQAALQALPPQQRDMLRSQIPQPYRGRL
ncbi:MAG: O-antigen ligase family protein [Curvibacter sp.]|jgi:O-antigen ligase|nr:O-antigen ligase family protein [Curvibacter sp.]